VDCLSPAPSQGPQDAAGSMAVHSSRLSELLLLAARVCTEHAAPRASFHAAAGLAGQPLAPRACRAAVCSPAAVDHIASRQSLTTLPEARTSSRALTEQDQSRQHSLQNRGNIWSGARTAHSAAAHAVEDVRQQHMRSADSLDVAPGWSAMAPSNSGAMASESDLAADRRRLLQAALVGAPNAGKSTLTNALVGQKVRPSWMLRCRMTGMPLLPRLLTWWCVQAVAML